MPRNIFGSRRNGAEGRIVFVEEFVVEPLPHNPARAVLDLADVNQHSRSRIDRTGENEIGDVIATAPVACIRFGPKSRQIFDAAPTVDVQAAGG